jgi:hypothetical protein
VIRSSGALLWLLGLGALGCSKKEDPPATLPSAAAPSAAPSAAAAQASAAPAATAAALPADAPTSFASATKETVENAVGLGCEARSQSGWLELLCRKRNGTGGKPVRAVLDADAGEELVADDKGELRVVVPFRAGESKELGLEWSDTRYTLKVDGAKAKLEWAGSNLEHRKACSKLLDESRAVISAAQKADAVARVLPTESAKLPRFGVCYPAGLGSWAVALRELAGGGDGATRFVELGLDVVRVDTEGKRLSASLGKLRVAPAGMEMKPLQIYDYDDDGHDEVIVSYDVTALPSGAESPKLTPIWSFSDSAVTPYAKAPDLGSAAAGVEQLDFDMRPDLGGYGPFVAWLGADCGSKDCPQRLTGPRLFHHSTPDGGFANNDAATQAALKRMCGKKPEAVVVEAAGKLNAAQTAKNLVCARAQGTTADAITSELFAKKKTICGEAESCPLYATLEGWTKVSL